jgi:hypothetical protein
MYCSAMLKAWYGSINAALLLMSCVMEATDFISLTLYFLSFKMEIIVFHTVVYFFLLRFCCSLGGCLFFRNNYVKPLPYFLTHSKCSINLVIMGW